MVRRMPLGTDLFGPVAADLARFEARIRDSISADGPPLAPAMGDLFSAGGKRLRPALVLLAGRLGRLTEAHLHAAMAVELTHAATLVHDDVIDRSPVRRGRPTIAATLGDAPAILVGDYYFAKAYQEAARSDDPAVVGAIASAVMTICRGELAQDRSRFDYRPSLEDYRARIEAKTAALLAASAWVGARLAGLPEAAQDTLRRYGLELGLAFQIADDVLDYTAEMGELGKPVGHDLLEGHATLPLLLADLPGELPAGEALSAAEVAGVVAQVRASNGPERALEEARRHAEDARRLLDGLPAGPARDSLAALANYVVERRL
jgi:geranylgeranyl pyrophosphate synthase